MAEPLLKKPQDSEVNICRYCPLKDCQSTHRKCLLQMLRRAKRDMTDKRIR